MDALKLLKEEAARKRKALSENVKVSLYYDGTVWIPKNLVVACYGGRYLELYSCTSRERST